MQEATFSSGEAEVYQSVSRTAVASVLMAFFGLGSFFFAFLVVLALLGCIFGILALRSIKKFPDELQGKSIAMVGLSVSFLVLILAPGYHTYVYLTEVPDGYERLSFTELLGEDKTKDIPPVEALQYDGKKVFIKGYIHPTSMDNAVSKKFVLVPDLGTCCFGGQPPLTHMIEVKLKGDQYARRGFRKQRLAGTLSISRSKKPVDGLDGVFYQLSADVLK